MHAVKTPKATLYVEIDAALKEQLDRLAAANRRKLVAEVSIAIERHLRAEKARLAREERDMARALDAEEDVMKVTSGVQS